MDQASSGKNQDLKKISKVTKVKRAGGMAQVVESLLSKHENEFKAPVTARKKKKSSKPSS
jgi:hypothetical protein